MKDEEKVLELMKNNNGILKTKDLYNNQINTVILTRLVRKELIQRVAKGLYIDSRKMEDAYYIFQYKCPKAIFSHETALYFHDLTDRTPIEFMVTVPSKYNSRYLKSSEYKFSYIKDELYEIGITKVMTPYSNEVYCYDIERTICDIIKNKNKMDAEIFSKALKEYAKSKNKNLSKLTKYARTMNIEKKVSEYMEVLL